MRTNKFIPLLIALFIHAIPLSYLAFKKADSSNESPQASLPQGIDLSAFSLAKKFPLPKSKNQKNGSAQKSVESLGQENIAQSPGGVSGDELSERTDGGPGSMAGSGPQLIQFNEPIYPPLARLKGVEGVVKVRAFYNSEGLVTQVEISKTSGAKMLDEAAKKAVSQWKLAKGKSGSFEKSFEFRLKN